MVTDDVENLLACNDPLLAALIRAEESGADPEIERLIVSVAMPLIERIATRFSGPRSVLPRHDAEDVTAAVSLRLLDKLRRTRSVPDDAIQDVEKYVSTLTYNVINDHLRRSYPERTRLKNKLRYIFTHDSRFDLWSAPGMLACGLRAWSGEPEALRSVPIEIKAATRTMTDRDRPAEALQAIFRDIGKPVDLEAVIGFTASIWHIVDLRPVDIADAATATLKETIPAQLERRELLRFLWREILELRPMQRKALLLNLREGGTVDVLSLLVRTRTALFDDIAAALEVSPDELAVLWNKLPLDDLQIAALLDITRQQVINLRKAARARLQRRLPR